MQEALTALEAGGLHRGARMILPRSVYKAGTIQYKLLEARAACISIQC